MNKKLNIFQQVRDLEGWRAIAFAATLVERMAPNYALFCQACEYEGAEQYRKTLNAIWEWLSVPKTKLNTAVHLEKIELVTPDAADFDNYGVFPAIDAAISLSSILLLMMGEDQQGAVVVSKLSQGSVEAFLEATQGEQEDVSADIIKAHPLMQWEIMFQQELLEMITQGITGAETVKQLKQLALQEGISNIGIEIDADTSEN